MSPQCAAQDGCGTLLRLVSFWPGFLESGRDLAVAPMCAPTGLQGSRLC